MSMITRYYASAEQASHAYQDLIQHGFSESIISLITPASSNSDDQTSVSKDMVSAAMKFGAQMGEQVDISTDNIARGYSMLAVEAPFGYSYEALNILDKYSPIAVEEPEADEPVPTPALISDRPAPFSSAIGLKVLTDSSWTLSEFIGIGFSAKRSFLSNWFSELTSSDFKFSNMFGMSMLSSNPAPFSSMFGLPTKSGKSGDGWTRSMGFKMLTDNPAPFSSFVGIPLLKDQYDLESYSPRRYRCNLSNPAPFSSTFGLPVLTKGGQSFIAGMFPTLCSGDFKFSSMFGMPLLSQNPAPLSSMFGMPTKSGKSGPEWKSSFGFPLLTKCSTPLSSALGWPVLSDL